LGTGRGILLNSGSNIEINGCTVTLDSTIITGTHNCFAKPTGATSHNVRLLNNVFSGGITPIQVYGKNDVELDTNWIIDGNKILNSYQRNAYIMYIRLLSVSHNQVISRAISPITAPLTTAELWCGFMIQMGSVNIMDGNRIILRYPTELPIGIAFFATNQSAAQTGRQNALLINNEIILRKKGNATSLTINGGSQRSNGALQLDYSSVDFYHNSVYMLNDVPCTWYGMYADYVGQGTNTMNIKNNNLVSTYAIPIWSPINTPLDYNNYYTEGPIMGYYGTNAANLAAWKAIANNPDTNSVSFSSSFIDPTKNLKMSSIGKLIAPRMLAIRNDIDNTTRGNQYVTMGCYEMLPLVTFNASLLDITGYREGTLGGQTDTVSVEVFNSAITTINSMELEWSVNGVYQSTSNYTNLSLNMGDKVKLPLGVMTYPSSNATIKVWIKSINGGLDGYQGDDTVSKTARICPNGYSGVLTIGPHSTFKTIRDAYAALALCGVGGDITFAFESGTYDANLDFTNSAAVFGNYKVTVTSIANNADSVIFKPAGTYGFTLGNTRNFTLKAITLNRRGILGYGIYFNNACTNIVIRDCKLLCDTTSTSSYGVIYKTSTGICDSIVIVNNVIEGEYYGIYWYDAGSTSTGYGTRFYIDSNIVKNQYYYGMYFYYYVDCKSISYNTVLSRTANTTTTWYGIAFSAYCNVYKMVSNRIIQRSTAISSSVYGIYPYQYINYYLNNGVRAYIANNEIVLYSTSTAYGIYAYYYLSADIYNNSIYIGGTGATHQGINAYYYGTINVKNNNIVMTSSSGYPIYTSSGTSFTSDYNNLYAPTNIGYYNGTATTVANGMATWYSRVPGEGHSVRVSPTFVDASANLKSKLELVNSTNIDSLRCPSLLSTDINGNQRGPITIMGAYKKQPVGLDLMAIRVRPTVNRVTNKQHLSVNVDVTNYGAVAINNATLQWTKNGIQQPPIPVTFNPLLSNQQQSILIDTFTVNGNIGDRINFVVRVDTINGGLDTVKWNDTASASYTIVPLAEFIAPPVDKPTNLLSFDVNVRIFEGTGAPVVAPKLYVQSTLNNYYQYNDSIVMKRTGGENWVATIPPQYYGCKVVYWLPVADTIGNSILLMDSTNIVFDLAKKDTIIIGTGVGTQNYNPYYYYYYSYTRNYYRSWEIDAERRGGYISSIAFYNTATAVSAVNNVSFYLKAVTDSTEGSIAYRNPLSDGATLVWGQATASASAPGWVTFQLRAPFYLPPNMNLLVYCDNNNGTTTSGTVTWQTTTLVGINTSMYAYGTSGPFPPSTLSSYSISGSRPNMRLVMQQVPVPYPVGNLSLTSLLAPINTNDSLCEISSSQLKVFVSNSGGYDYDFTEDTITIGCKVISPDSNLNKDTIITVNQGGLKSGASAAFEIIKKMPVVAGNTYIKVWVNSPMDHISYDDTLTYVYVSEKVGLPIDEVFASPTMPVEFVSKPGDKGGTWEIYRPVSGDKIQPDSAGTGILRFMGLKGASAELTTRQLDLYGSLNPILEFWYYHDTTLDLMNNSVLEVTIYRNKVPNTVLTILKRDRTYGHGWHKYTVPLNAYTQDQCVYIGFLANNKADADVGQYIDRIIITSDLDVAVSGIFVDPVVTSCNIRNKDISVVLRTTTNQAIDFSDHPTNIKLEIPGIDTVVYPLTQGHIAGNSSATFKVASGINFKKGMHTIKAYLSTPVDSNHVNDVKSEVLNINPAINIITEQSSSAGYCLSKGMEVYQQLVVKNTGNMDVSGIEVVMEVDDTPPQIRHYTINTTLHPGETDTVYMPVYTVPASNDYYVNMSASMRCDSALVHTDTSVRECVEMSNLSIELIKPAEGATAAAGTANEIEIVLRNAGYASYQDVKVTAVFEDANGAPIGTPAISEVIPYSDPTDTALSYTFKTKYTVPSNDYCIRVFLDRVDSYQNDDTTAVRCFSVTGLNTIAFDKFALGQNTPNPAKHTTRIEYSVPNSGEVIFTIHSVSGQVLYTKTIQSEQGKQFIDLNTNDFAAGVYFYSMEYKGQKLVKRMSVRN